MAPAATWPQALLAVSQETARIPGWRAALAASPVGADPFGEGYARLRELAAGLPARRHIIHGDLVNRNVLVQDAAITAVIDWGNAMYGTSCMTRPGSSTGGLGSRPGRSSSR